MPTSLRLRTPSNFVPTAQTTSFLLPKTMGFGYSARIYGWNSRIAVLGWLLVRMIRSVMYTEGKKEEEDDY